jgi:hypothetical protein
MLTGYISSIFQQQKNKTPKLMETTSKSPADEKMPVNTTAPNLDGSQGRLIFFGPQKTMERLKGRPLEPLGEPVTRQEIKELAIEYVRRVTNPAAALDTYKEPMTLLIEKEDIDALFSDPRCTRLVALLAVETKEDHNRPHQTFVLMPCDDYGRVVGSDSDGIRGVERWSILKSVESIRIHGDIDRDIEAFLTDEFHI